MQLVHKSTQVPVKVGDTVTSFRGETAKVTGWQEPRHAGSTGRVYVREGRRTMSAEYFPGVFDLVWEGR